MRTKTLLLVLALLASANAAVGQTTESESNVITDPVETGAELLTPLDSLQALVLYPRHFCVEGRVIVAVTIEADGSISAADVLRGIIPETDAEAVRVARLARFRPAEQLGNPVRSRFTIPISFGITR